MPLHCFVHSKALEESADSHQAKSMLQSMKDLVEQQEAIVDAAFLATTKQSI